MFQDLISERDQLRKLVAAVQAERGTYLHALHALTRKQVTFNGEERSDLEKKSVPAEQVLQEIERIVGQASRDEEHG